MVTRDRGKQPQSDCPPLAPAPFHELTSLPCHAVCFSHLTSTTLPCPSPFILSCTQDPTTKGLIPKASDSRRAMWGLGNPARYSRGLVALNWMRLLERLEIFPRPPPHPPPPHTRRLKPQHPACWYSAPNQSGKPSNFPECFRQTADFQM